MMEAVVQNVGGMIVTKIDYLRRAKALEEGRDITLRTVASEAGVSINVLQRLRGEYPGGVTLASLELLCRYFGVKSVADIIEYVPSDQSPAN